jgi:hypothetical protein
VFQSLNLHTFGKQNFRQFYANSAVFLWLCSKDLTKLNFSNMTKGSPEEILMNLQRGQTTYAVVFEILCR